MAFIPALMTALPALAGTGTAAATGTALATGTAATAATAGSVGLMEAAALGIPSIAATAALPTAATAGTAGLFGTGGAFSLAQTLGTLGTLGSFVAPILSGNQAANVAEANADIAAMEARSKAETGRTQARKLSRESSSLVGAQRAGYGKAGVGIEGSPLAVMADTAAQYGEDIYMTGRNAGESAKASMFESELYSSMAKNKRRAGWFQAGMSLLPTAKEAAVWS